MSVTVTVTLSRLTHFHFQGVRGGEGFPGGPGQTGITVTTRVYYVLVSKLKDIHINCLRFLIRFIRAGCIWFWFNYAVRLAE